MSVRWSDIPDDIDEGRVHDQTESSGTKRKGALKGVARGMTPRGEMNQTEKRWARLLDNSEDVLWWVYETLRIRYGNKGWHAPDFCVLRLDGKIEIHETKAHCTDAGRTRFKAGARAFPVARWIMVQQKSPKRPWECIYDTEGNDGAPFIDT